MNLIPKVKKSTITLAQHIYEYVLILVAIILVISGCLVALIVYKNAQQRTLSRLNVAFEVIDTQIQDRSREISTIIEQSSYYENLGNYIHYGTTQTMDTLIKKFASFPDSYAAFIDINGTVLASNVHKAGEDWPLSYILKHLHSENDAIISTEAISSDDLLNISDSFKNLVTLPGESELPDTVLIQLTVIPICYDGELCGAFAGGFVLNNNSTLADKYTESVPNTYLSIADTNGTRICSNIDVNTFSYKEGTIQSQKLIETTNSGSVWKGIEQMESKLRYQKKGFVVAHPLFNANRIVVGNYGVGSPLFEVEEFSYRTYITILIAILVIFITSAFILHHLSNSLTAPIRILQQYSIDVARSSDESSDSIYDRLKKESRLSSTIPIEYQDLAESINTMAAKLTSENHLLEDKVNARTADMKRLILQLQEASSAKSQFLANCTHELRTPLNSVLGFTALLLDGEAGALNNTQCTYLNVISESGEHLLTLIDELLTFSRESKKADTLEPETVNIKELIEAQIRSFMPMTRAKDQELTLEMPKELYDLTANWDSGKIRQVLLNLINNAYRNTPEQGSIKIRVTQPGPTVCQIDVTDNGIGIEDSMKEKVFMIFEQINPDDPANKGLGLGLALCRNMINLHHGLIWILDAEPHGTDVRILLPLDPNTVFSSNDLQQEN